MEDGDRSEMCSVCTRCGAESDAHLCLGGGFAMNFQCFAADYHQGALDALRRQAARARKGRQGRSSRPPAGHSGTL
eukprot:9388996-Pyramimonas_sp.AAC.1